MIKEKESEDGDPDLYGKDLDHYYDKKLKDYLNKATREIKNSYLNKTTRETENSYLNYQQEKGKKRKEVKERKEKDKKKVETKFERKKKEEKEKARKKKREGEEEKKPKKEQEGKKPKKEKEGKKPKEEKEGKKEKNMDNSEVKFAEVSRGAAHAKQKERSEAFCVQLWRSESMFVNMLLVVVMAVCMYMISGVENILKRKVLGLKSASEQDRSLPDRDRRPSRKGLSKANGFRKRRHVRRRLALVGQVFKIMLFFGVDTVHAMQHGPEPNPAATNGPASGSAEAPSADQVLAQVLRQNTEALQKLMQGSTSSSSEVSRNLESASRILKNPDYFGGGSDVSEASFALWKHQFSNWLTFGDDRFRTLFEAAETQTAEANMEDFSADGKQLSRKLYRILTSYLKGPALAITRSIRQTENGFLVWQRLNAEHRPMSRQRGMALAQVLATYPAFPKDKSVMECILALEEVVHQYNQVTGEEYPKSLLMVTLIRCSPPNLRQHLQLTLQDSSTYKSVKETMLLYEKTTKAWSSESVLREVGATQGGRQGDEPTPMEVDQVQGHYKGKGKGKNKGKTKGKSNWSTWGFGAGSAWKGRGRGKGKGGRKGKGKSKGKKGKGKAKGKKGSKGGKKGGSKGDRCRLCGQPGHWGNECPNRMMVGQAAETSVPDNASTQAPSSSASASTGRVIRQVKMFHMGTPPSTLPEAFEVCTSEEEELELQWCRVVQEFPLTENELSEANVRGDGWQAWRELEFLESESDVQVRMVQEPQGHDDDEWVILDSGADLSLLPQRLRGRGKPIDVPNLQVSDAQGGSLPIRDMRRVVLSTEWSDLTGVMIQEDFAGTNVKSILLSLGKLLKKGWHLEETNPVDANNSNNQQQSSRATMQLTSPCGNYGIPVFYRRNSLAIRCQVCEVQAEDKEAKVCEIFVELPEDVDQVTPEEWSVIQEDRVYGPVFRKTSTQKFMNPSYWMQAWPYRTTLIRKKGEGNRWMLVELCDKMADLLDPFGKIPQAKEPVESITLLHVVKIEEPEMVGKVLEMTKMFEQERNDDESRDIFKDLMEDYEPQGNVEPVPKGGGLEEKTELKSEDKLQLGDLEISKDSSQKVLKEAAEHLGLSKAGSKEKIWKRICEFQKKERLKGKLRRELEGPRPQGPLPVKQPTEEERKRREVTHLPYQPWCEECVKCRAKADKVLWRIQAR